MSAGHPRPCIAWILPYLRWKIHRRICQAVLKIIREQELDRLGPQFRLRFLDILCHVCFALPVENVDIFAVGKPFAVWQGCPDEVLKLRKSCGDIGNALALLELYGCRHTLPEICHGVDDVCSFKGTFKAIGVIEVGLDDFDTLFGQLLTFA